MYSASVANDGLHRLRCDFLAAFALNGVRQLSLQISNVGNDNALFNTLNATFPLPTEFLDLVMRSCC
jgi:hypothetical protein